MTGTVEKKRAVENGVKKAVLCGIAIALQAVWLFFFIGILGRRYPWLSFAVDLLAVLLVLQIYAGKQTASIRMSWIMLILAFPFLGMFLYLVLGQNGGTKKMRRRYAELDAKLLPLLERKDEELSRMRALDEGAASQSHYIREFSGYPAYGNTDVAFYDDAAKGYAAQLEDLAKAEKFIFMEYHAIEDSKAFEPLHDILKKKASEGVEVRVFYDYVGSMSFIGNSFAKKMEADGIHCRVFNPMTPFLNFFMNNRDHRKITVIDGKVGFVGGYNLADEYFHVTSPYGYWLDTGIRMEGDAVRSLTVTFLENWNAIQGVTEDPDFRAFLPDVPYAASENGFVQPYADSPMDDEQVGENVYINVLRNAKRYAYFTTPYLVITDEMRHAFVMAAKSGVDVRIITPGIPDKAIVYSLTRSYYSGLAQNGVRIYEYTPGFCHAKQCVSDDRVATCGTINLDFRSLYHHFENGVFLCEMDAVREIKAQFDALFPQCREVTEEYRSGKSSVLRLKQLILRLVAPLL